MENLFAYGTLMCEEIMQEVSGTEPSSLSGTLSGYRRHAIKNAHYPGIVPEQSAYVKGLIYQNLPDWAWERLDRFEGEMYQRQPVRIERRDGGLLTAAAYVVKPAFYHHLEPFDWDFDRFLREGKQKFMNHYQGYQALSH